MKKVLVIDSSKSDKLKIGLRVGDKTTYLTSSAKVLKSQAILPLIEKVLKKYKLNPSNIDAIEVHTGPGSFTGLRVGTAVANALGFALKIPVNGKKIGEIVTPEYEARPQ